MVSFPLMVESEPKPAEVSPAKPHGMPLEGSSFHTAMAHLYRAEMHRMTVWRMRLDVTTNWAIILTMGLTTFALGSPQVPHYIMLLGLSAIAFSILIEARRYRHLHHSQWRLHILERDYFGWLLGDGGSALGEGWRGEVAHDLREPRLRVSLGAACRLRLRRNYLFLVYFITAVWLTKIFVHPASPQTLSQYYDRFAVGGLFPPLFVVATAALFIATATCLAVVRTAGEPLESHD